MHGEGAGTQYLHAIHPDVADPRLRVFGYDHWKCDVRPRILGPARNYRKLPQIDLIALPDNLLTDRLPTTHPRRKLPDFQEPRQHRQLPHQPLGNLEVEQLGNARANLIEVVDFERERHPAHRTKEVDRDREFRPLTVVEDDVLEKQRLSTAGLLHHAIGYLAQLESRPDRLGHAGELTCIVDCVYELRKIVQAHITPMRNVRRRGSPRSRKTGWSTRLWKHPPVPFYERALLRPGN